METECSTPKAWLRKFCAATWLIFAAGLWLVVAAFIFSESTRSQSAPVAGFGKPALSSTSH